MGIDIMKHGLWNTRLYRMWYGMIARCHTNKEGTQGYKNYRSRGIQVCDEWRELTDFQKWALENGYDEENRSLSIERKNVNGNYEPDNCIFIDVKDQPANKRNTKRITAFQETKRLIEWLDDPRCVVNYATLFFRINNGLDPEKSITTPPNKLPVPKRAPRYLVWGESKTLEEWSEDERCNVHYITIQRRINSGMNIEEAITKPSPSSEINIFGEVKTISLWARDPRCAVSEVAFEARIHRGWPPEEALTKPSKKKPKGPKE